MHTVDNEQENVYTASNNLKKPGKARWLAMGTLAMALVFGLALLGQYIHDINNVEDVFAQALENPSPSVQAQTPEHSATRPPAASMTPTAAPTLSPEEALAQQSDSTFSKNRVNILALGFDRSTERLKSNSFRSDTMVLISINFDDNTVSMISIPRDSYVKIHNKKAHAKINSAFGVGGGFDKNGFDYAMRTVSMLFGDIPVQYYVGFDMNVVKDMVNAMGGVDYEVDIDVKMNGRTLSPGWQHLDGQAVLDYCRQRKGSSDTARVERQQRMLVAIYRQLVSTKQITKIPEIYRSIQDNLDTNLSFKQICSLALFATKIKPDDINRYMVEGDYIYLYEVCYWGISNAKLKTLVNEVFGVSFNPDSAADLSVLRRKSQEQETAKEQPTAAPPSPKAATTPGQVDTDQETQEIQELEVKESEIQELEAQEPLQEDVLAETPAE